MKRKISILLVLCLCTQVFTGCEKTPDDVIVKEKNKKNMSNYETAEDTKTPLREQVGAPEHYTSNLSFQDGRIVIDTDADVFVPDVTSVNTVQVTAKDFSQEVVDKITKAFFGDSPIYDGVEYFMPTKSELEQKIATLKKFAAEGNLDPYDYGLDAEGNATYDIYAVIEAYESMIKDAPEVIEKKLISPGFGKQTTMDEDKEVVMDDYFIGVAETEDGVYEYSLTRDNNYSILFDVKIDKKREGLDGQMFSQWVDAWYLMNRQGETNENGESFTISEQEVQELANISYEDAKAIADEKVNALGLEGMELQETSYALFQVGEKMSRDNIIDGGYQFFYTRVLDGFPITYTMEYGGGVEDMDSTVSPWGYEVCEIIVGDDGIQRAYIYNLYDIGEVQKKNVKLMNFDEIIKLYEQMMEIKNADMDESVISYTVHIQDIKLGYARLYDPKSDNKTGVLVPVWNFFGGTDIETMEGYSDKNSGENSLQSFMTVNALDGSIIDLGLGY